MTTHDKESAMTDQELDAPGIVREVMERCLQISVRGLEVSIRAETAAYWRAYRDAVRAVAADLDVALRDHPTPAPSPLARLEAWRSANPTRTVSIRDGFVGLAEYRTWTATNGETTLGAQVASVVVRAEDRPAELGDPPPGLIYLGPGATFEAMITAALDRWEELRLGKEMP